MLAKPVLRYRDDDQIIQLWYFCGTNVDQIPEMAKIKNNPANEGANIILILADVPTDNGEVVTRLYRQFANVVKADSNIKLFRSAQKWVNKQLNSALDAVGLHDVTEEPDLAPHLSTIGWVARFSYLASHGGQIVFGVFALMALMTIAAAPHSVLMAATLLASGAVAGTLLHRTTHQAELTENGTFSFS